MDIKKFEILLKKINTLKQSMDLSGEDISELEVDLLRNYIKRLHATLAADTDDEMDIVEKNRKKKKKKKTQTPAPDIDREERDLLEEESKEELPEIAIDEAMETTERSEQLEKLVEKDELVYDEELLALFDTDSSSDLSEKLSTLPIKDLKRAIGINERIFTINELFGGDKDLYNVSMEQMNHFNSFEDAKKYLLENVAVIHNWGKQVNHKKVRKFIKIVMRRYAE